MNNLPHPILVALVTLVLLPEALFASVPAVTSFPPAHPFPPLAHRPIAAGPGYFVDSKRGDDTNPGTEKAPWKTVNHALAQLKAGDTLYLREGVYHENVYCSVAGKEGSPITIRSYPDERVVIDGGMSEFLETPDKAWEPCPDGVADEYRSTKTYKNIRDLLGLFADSNVGLQTYWHAMDLRATNENNIPDPEKKLMVLPIYCGPGLWYDRDTGYIHARLAHTHLDVPGVPNYEGETDPRKMPLVISAYNSLPLFLDQAMYVRLQDLVVRGGGSVSVLVQFGIHVDLDNLAVYGGSTCLRARSTGPLRMTNSALYGMIPPWGSYFANGLYTYSSRYYDPFLPGPETANLRNITRLPTHYVMVAEGFDESSIFCYPFNHDWEISYSEFTDGFDGIELCGPNMRFHHNWVGDIRSNAIELSSPSLVAGEDAYYYQNLITSCAVGFTCHPLGGDGAGQRYLFRNILDNRKGVYFDQPSDKYPHGRILNTTPFLVHGKSETAAVPSISFYQNTIISPKVLRAFAHAALYHSTPDSVRRVLNNLFVYLGQYPEVDMSTYKTANEIQVDGNLHWCPNSGIEIPSNFLQPVRLAKGSIANETKYATAWEANSLVADPKFARFDLGTEATNDYHLQQGSPAIAQGVDLPPALEDPLRPKDGSRPDIGAIPFGGDTLKVGIQGRIEAGTMPGFKRQ